MTQEELLKLDYEQTAAYFKELHETRFRLLGLLPLLTGLPIAFTEDIRPPVRIALGVLGLLVTIGLTIYDQRNSMIYDRLVRRAKLLEQRMGFIPMQVPPKNVTRETGGPFTDRPPRRLRVWPFRDPAGGRSAKWKLHIIWHDLGLSLVYGAAFGSWVFLIASGIQGDPLVPLHPLVIWLPATFGFIMFIILVVFAVLNDCEDKRIEHLYTPK